MPKKYRKKPINVEAIQWTGSNWQEIQGWGCKSSQTQDDELWIPTLEGIIKASEGDYIIKGIRGEFYPCKPDIFNDSYDKLEKGLYIDVSVKDLDFVDLLAAFMEQIELSDYKDENGHELKMNQAYSNLLEELRIDRHV